MTVVLEPAPSGEAPPFSGNGAVPASADWCRRADRPSPVAATRLWTINGDFLALAPTGVARYAREVTLALDGLVGEGHPLARGLELDLVAPRSPRDPLALEHIRQRIVPEPSRPRLPQFWVQAQLPRHVRGGLLSFCNLAPVLARRHIVCIHDMQTRLTPESYGRLFRWAHYAILPLLGRRAARLVTVSDTSRDHLVRFGIAAPGKVTVALNGADHAFRWRPERPTWRGERPFVLGIGRPQAHKNPELFLRLAPALDALGLDLVVAGDLAGLAASDLPVNLRLLGRIGDHELAGALEAALCFVLPSRAEGFGLPAIESMARGCPVIASSAPALPEVCGDAALFVDPESPSAWVAAITALKGSEDLRGQLIAAGRARARQFTWRRVAETYLDLMGEVDREAAHRDRRRKGA